MAPLVSVTSTFRESISLISLQNTRYPLFRRTLFLKSNDFGSSQKKRIIATLKSNKPEIVNPLVNIHPFGDEILNYIPDNEVQATTKQEHGLLKNEIRKELLKTMRKPLEYLKLVDTLERLGVAYHFENMIDETLRDIYNNMECIQEDNNLNLYHTSLMFRILRQHGYYVTSNVFEKFTNKQRNFLETLEDDVESIMCLYEAAHLRVHGEDVLEKALEFSKTRLNAIIDDDAQSTHPFALQISRALKYPIQEGVTRLESRYFISFYEQNPCHNESVLKFAKLDYNILQSMYKEEIKEIDGWMKSYDMEKKFPFARMRALECHFFSLDPFFEPQFSTIRYVYSKSFVLLSILDDLYEEYGIIEELEALTEAMKRWDKRYIDQLSGCTREYYEILLDAFDEFENDMAKLKSKSYVNCVRNEAIKFAEECMKEQKKWRQESYVPTYEEFLNVSAYKTSGISYVIALSLLENEVEESVVKKTFEKLACTDDKLLRVAFIIGRLTNDIVDFEFDRERGHVPGSVACFMKQYGVSKEDACVAINVVVEDAWKDLVEEILRPTTSIPKSSIKRVHNFCRVCNYLYKYGYGNVYTIPTQRMKTTLKLLYAEPV